jgi:hypothetical protein
MDLTLILLGIIGSWFVVWASVSFLNETRHTRRVMRSWEYEEHRKRFLARGQSASIPTTGSTAPTNRR